MWPVSNCNCFPLTTGSPGRGWTSLFYSLSCLQFLEYSICLRARRHIPTDTHTMPLCIHTHIPPPCPVHIHTRLIALLSEDSNTLTIFNDKCQEVEKYHWWWQLNQTKSTMWMNFDLETVILFSTYLWAYSVSVWYEQNPSFFVPSFLLLSLPLFLPPSLPSFICLFPPFL